MYFQEQVNELKEKLESSQKNEEEQRKAVQTLESSMNEAEREKLRQQTHDAKKVQVTLHTNVCSTLLTCKVWLYYYTIILEKN